MESNFPYKKTQLLLTNVIIGIAVIMLMCAIVLAQESNSVQSEVSSLESLNVQNEALQQDIGRGLFYHIKSSIFRWFSSLATPSKSTYVSNVPTYEEEKEKYSDYWADLNAKRQDSQYSQIEPPFNSTMCWVDLLNPDKVAPCSCGDGYCASYENKCDCPKDCGDCKPDEVCLRGECTPIESNKCMNLICEGGENETCPWDCKMHMQEFEEEIISAEEKIIIDQRIEENRDGFFRSNNLIYEESNQSGRNADSNSQETLSEQPED